MNIYKLSAPTEKKIKDFIVKLTEPKDEDGNPAPWRQYLSNLDKGIHNCVYIGQIVATPAVYNEQEELVTEATYEEGYHADIMADKELTIPSGITVHNPENPVHTFA